MKHSLTLTLLAVALSLTISPLARAHDGHVHDHAKDHAPAHGGVVVEHNHMDWELVAKPERIDLYVRNMGKKVSTQGASGKLTLLSGKDKQEAVLKPAGDNRLEAAGPFKLGPGTKVVATITLAGKAPANVRFALK
ncbi:MAG: hypothetical protein J0L58_20145 [Burkholderiales bacterium]|nr:hypothetical protein [Burkholderiales bacterium]